MNIVQVFDMAYPPATECYSRIVLNMSLKMGTERIAYPKVSFGFGRVQAFE